MTPAAADAPGKVVGNYTYIHISALSHLTPQLQTQVAQAAALSELRAGVDFNVVKINASLTSISFLEYPDFFDRAFPTLLQSWTTDCTRKEVRHRSYATSLNPPVLHRKELLLPQSSPGREVFEALTSSAEQIGLFDDTVRIGFLRGWEQLLISKGFRVVGHALVPLGNEEMAEADTSSVGNSGAIARHLTALTRFGFSAPIQSLARYGFLDGSRSLFDYGCGRGDDLRGLRENGIPAKGWDPYFAPGESKVASDIVNLGFVINVIENIEERIEALQGAFSLAGQVLVVAAMIRSEASITGEAYADGIVTSRRTFQKYYTQAELRQFIVDVLNEEPLAVAPGIFFIFRDKDEEQRFQYGRLDSRRETSLRISPRTPPPRPPPRAPRISRPRVTALERAQIVYNDHHQVLDHVWRAWIDMGRPPVPEELPGYGELLARFGSLNAAMKLIRSVHKGDMALVQTSADARAADLSVYFARLYFERRRKYHTLEGRLQRDIKAFFGSFEAAMERARELLASLADPSLIDAACRQAAAAGLGWYIDGESLQLHSTLVPRLPALLRVYIECATILHGDVASSDILKIHVHSSKLTLMRFDNFVETPLPRMMQRIKINLRTQELDIFDYVGDHTPPYLYEKSRFINEEFPHYAEQLHFEESLDAIGLLRFPGYGPSPADFDGALEQRRFQLDGFRLGRSTTVPPLSARCGDHFNYYDLVRAGETMSRLSIENVPNAPETYNALADLAQYVLDPVIDYFGMIRLTYGFCSAALARHISGRIAPALDQHAAHERRRSGALICERLGAACDFFVEDEDMEEVARWVAANTPFDRLYYYGKKRPIHVSFGPEEKREFVEMRTTDSGRQVPRIRKDVALFSRHSSPIGS